MNEFIFLGIRRIDMTDRNTGRPIKGYSVWLVEEKQAGFAAGVIPIKNFLDDVSFSEVFGSMESWYNMEFTRVRVTFGYRGRIVAIESISSK